MADKRIILVTGASRGVGKGIALALGDENSIVYVTGRTRSGDLAALPGTVDATAAEIKARGGDAVAVGCDHRDDGQIAALFDQIKAEQGTLDILVNNVFAVPDTLLEDKPFWEKPMSYWDDMIDLGLRSHYVASVHGAKIMAVVKKGLIVNISSFGARCMIHTPIYGIGKAGADKMAQDMGKELAPFNVAMVSLWLGIVKTERTNALMEIAPDAYAALMEGVESPEYPGRVINALYSDVALLDKAGKTWICSELGGEYGITDVGGRIPKSYRSMLGAPADPHPAFIK